MTTVYVLVQVEGGVVKGAIPRKPEVVRAKPPCVRLECNSRTLVCAHIYT